MGQDFCAGFEMAAWMVFVGRPGRIARRTSWEKVQSLPLRALKRPGSSIVWRRASAPFALSGLRDNYPNEMIGCVFSRIDEIARRTPGWVRFCNCLGAVALPPNMPEVRFYLEAVVAAGCATLDRSSIVNGSISSAIEG